jgi:hypothetical protein
MYFDDFGQYNDIQQVMMTQGGVCGSSTAWSTRSQSDLHSGRSALAQRTEALPTV